MRPAMQTLVGSSLVGVKGKKWWARGKSNRVRVWPKSPGLANQSGKLLRSRGGDGKVMFWGAGCLGWVVLSWGGAGLDGWMYVWISA